MNRQSGDRIYSIQDPDSGSRNGNYGTGTAVSSSPEHKHSNTVEIVDSVTLDKGSENPLECFGYRHSAWRCVFFWLFVILTAGLLLLVMYWKPVWKLKLTKRRCSLRQADTVLLKDPFGHLFVESVQKIILPDGIVGEHVITEVAAVSSEDTRMLAAKQMNFVKYFDHHQIRYIWDKNNQYFSKLEGLDGNLTIAVIHDEYSKGLGEAEQQYKLHLYGENSIVVKVKSYFKLFIEEVLNPFYVFQICSIILWSLDDYYVYASCIFLISAISLGVELYETRRQSETLRDMVSSAETTLTVCRGSSEEEVHTTQLVPGDVVIIPANGCIMMCDAVLLSGNAIVNESMLTGESVPVTKTPLAQSEANEIYSSEVHKRHTLFCGTHVIQTRYYGDAKVKAVVVGTGFSTAKGELVRSILYPKPMGFKFYKDAMKFILLLACVAAVGMTYSIVILVKQGAAVEKVILRALDIITIVVPPALPAAMTVGTVYAQNRLKKAGIFCISPPRINVCGKLKCICFDKTGTLTEDGLDFWGIVPTYQDKFQLATQNPAELNTRGNLMAAMATCHSLTMIGGELNGDPLDLIMFNATNWEFEEPGKDTSRFDNLVPTVVRPKPQGATGSLAQVEPPTDPVWVVPPAEHDLLDPSGEGLTKLQLETEPQYEIGIIRQFTFSSSLQRMSVITRVLGADHMNLYCKGAPEKVASLCKKETLPDDFHDVLQRYTMQGFRVIGLAWRPLESKLTWPQAQRISREKVETDLSFLGLLILENTLKPETTPVIHQLREADIRTVMVTGDNMLTAISVARQCGMVPGREAVILVNVHPPEDGKPASIHWEYADVDNREDEMSDTESTDDHAADTDGPGRVVMRDEHESDEHTLYQSSVTIDRDFTLKYHFAVTGRSFSLLKQYFPSLMPKICVRGTVFARMSPDQKSQLVEQLQDLGYCVGMCGDGANDCGALKTAHAGISLSEAEASVASPFTSKNANIECVPTVIREGRAALTTSFGVFKYMALYSMVQFVSVLILYSKETNLGDWMFLYIDLVITTTVAVLMGHTGAYYRLVRKRPAGSLVAPSNVFSVGMHMVLVVGFQAGTYFLLLQQPWFTPVEPNIKLDNVFCWETTVIFYVSAFQYLMLAFVFSKGPPYRKPIWTNVLFLVSLIILTGITMWLVIYPPGFLKDLLQLKVIPDDAFWFRFVLLGIVAANFLAAFILESFIVPSSALKRCANSIRKKRMPKNKYKLIERDLAAEPCWPPVGEYTLQNGVQPTGAEASVVTLDQTTLDLRESDT